jgi:hypothetical protein
MLCAGTRAATCGRIELMRLTMKIDPQAMKNAYAEVERLRGSLNSLFFKMEEAEPHTAYPRRLAARYFAAKDVVSAAADDLLAALDHLRT